MNTYFVSEVDLFSLEELFSLEQSFAVKTSIAMYIIKRIHIASIKPITSQIAHALDELADIYLNIHE